MAIRVIVKSREDGSGEELYLCTEEGDFDKPASYFFVLAEGDSIDIDVIVDSIKAFENLPLPMDRPLKAV